MATDRDPISIVKSALHDTVQAVNSGVTPTAALKKVAEARQLSPDFIARTGEALNVALTHKHFKTASDRSASFPIADVQGVVKELFAGGTKTTEAKLASLAGHADIPDYKKWLTNKGFQEKKAELMAVSEPKRRMSDRGLAKAASASVYALKDGYEAAEVKCAGIERAAQESALSAISALSKKGATPFHEVESQVYAKLGEAAVPYLDFFYKEAAQGQPRGERDAGYFAFEPCKEAGLIEKAIVAARAEASASKDLFAKFAEYVDALDAVAEIGAISGIKLAASGGSASFISNMANKAFRKEELPPGVKLLGKTDNLVRSTMLQALIARDPILSKVSPRKVAAAYAQIMRLGPHISKEKEVVRSLLRQMVQADGLGVYEAQLVIDAESKLLRNKINMYSTKPQTGGGKDKD